jgi:iron complex outermembrane receptor protein
LGEDSPVASSAPSLTDIIVTAQKREQGLQQVPLAISVIEPDKLAALQISNVRDLSGLAPNVTVLSGVTSSSAAIITIRGVSTPASETFGLDTANGLYIDGIYIARSGSSGLEIADIARVEVLRGPQGTLFGRNTTGGAIAFISRLPEQQLAVQGELGFGNFSGANARIRIDTGEIAQGLTASLTFAHRERGGTVDNLLQSRSTQDPGALKADSVRIALRYEVGSSGYIQYIFDRSKVDGHPPAFQLVELADGTPPAPLIIDGIEVAQTRQAPAAPYVSAARFLEPECAALGSPTRSFQEEICLNSAARATDRTEGQNLQAGNDFGDFNLRMIAGFRRWKSISRGGDLDGLGTIEGAAFTFQSLLNGLPLSLIEAVLPPAALGSAPSIAAAPVPQTTADLFFNRNQRRHEQFSTELEVSGETDRLDWVAGGFYFWERGTEDNEQTSGFVIDTDAIFRERFGSLGAALTAANPARYRLAVTAARLQYLASAESTALYGQTTLYPGGRASGFALTVGGRYTWDIKSILRQQNGAERPAVPESGRAQFSKFTWGLTGRYELTSDASVYLRLASGYRSGGFNASDPSIAGTGSIPAFKDETVTSYELGLKSAALAGRLRFNLAAYRNDYRGLAITVPVLTGSGTFQSRVSNAGKVIFTGIEADFEARLGGGFSVSGAAGYVDVAFREFFAGQPINPAEPVVDIAGFARPALVAPLTANIALDWATPVGSGGAAFKVRLGYTHEEGRYSFNNAISSPFNEAIRGDDVDLFDAQVMLDNLEWGGGRMRIMLWAKNLTDDNNLMRAIDFGPLGYAGGIFNEPRTYGAALGAQF